VALWQKVNGEQGLILQNRKKDELKEKEFFTTKDEKH